jgi:hypothetical protein
MATSPKAPTKKLTLDEQIDEIQKEMNDIAHEAQTDEKVRKTFFELKEKRNKLRAKLLNQ